MTTAGTFLLLTWLLAALIPMTPTAAQAVPCVNNCLCTPGDGTSILVDCQNKLSHSWQGFSQSTVTLDISRNNLTTLDQGNFGILPRLNVLNVNHNQLNSIANDTFESVKQLRHLYLKDNNFTEVPSAALALLLYLNELDLSSNPLGSIASPIVDTINIRTLRLVNCQLTNISDDALDNMYWLENLFLDSNKLTSLPDGLLEFPYRFHQLSLSNNLLDKLPTNIACPLLRTLDMSRNKLSSIPSKALHSNYPMLLHLNLSGNHLANVPTGVITSCIGLKTIDLSRNGIAVLPFNVFPSSITQLFLEDNLLTTLSAGVLGFGVNLEQLSLKNNRISSLPSSIFDSMRNVKTIDLSGNALSDLPYHIFTHNPHLTASNLMGNPYMSTSRSRCALTAWNLVHNSPADATPAKPELIHRSPGQAVVLGATAVLVCTFESTSPFHVEWLLDGTKVNIADPRRTAKLGVDSCGATTPRHTATAKLVITNVKPEDTQMYTCRAHPHGAPSLTVDGIVELKVVYAPALTVELPSRRSYRPHFNITLRCAANSNPSLSSIQWVFMQNGRAQVLNNRLFRVVTDISAGTTALTLLRPSKYHHEGVYECLFKNSIGNGTSSMTLIIDDPGYNIDLSWIAEFNRSTSASTLTGHTVGGLVGGIIGIIVLFVLAGVLLAQFGPLIGLEKPGQRNDPGRRTQSTRGLRDAPGGSLASNTLFPVMDSASKRSSNVSFVEPDDIPEKTVQVVKPGGPRIADALTENQEDTDCDSPVLGRMEKNASVMTTVNIEKKESDYSCYLDSSGVSASLRQQSAKKALAGQPTSSPSDAGFLLTKMTSLPLHMRKLVGKKGNARIKSDSPVTVLNFNAQDSPTGSHNHTGSGIDSPLPPSGSPGTAMKAAYSAAFFNDGLMNDSPLSIMRGGAAAASSAAYGNEALASQNALGGTYSNGGSKYASPVPNRASDYMYAIGGMDSPRSAATHYNNDASAHPSPSQSRGEYSCPVSVPGSPVVPRGDANAKATTYGNEAIEYVSTSNSAEPAYATSGSPQPPRQPTGIDPSTSYNNGDLKVYASPKSRDYQYAADSLSAQPPKSPGYIYAAKGPNAPAATEEDYTYPVSGPSASHGNDGRTSPYASPKASREHEYATSGPSTTLPTTQDYAYAGSTLPTGGPNDVNGQPRQHNNGSNSPYASPRSRENTYEVSLPSSPVSARAVQASASHNETYASPKSMRSPSGSPRATRAPTSPHGNANKNQFATTYNEGIVKSDSQISITRRGI